MEQKERSLVVTVVNVVALTAANYFVSQRAPGLLVYLLAWPIALFWCVFIAARIWHGHNSL